MLFGKGLMIAHWGIAGIVGENVCCWQMDTTAQRADGMPEQDIDQLLIEL